MFAASSRPPGLSSFGIEHARSDKGARMFMYSRGAGLLEVWVAHRLFQLLIHLLRLLFLLVLAFLRC